MNDSKIGTWLMRDGGTAVVLVDNKSTDYDLQGIADNGSGIFKAFSWLDNGLVFRSGESRYDLIRKVSDSTELKPWKPVKKWRPWTIDEAAEAIVRGLFVTENGDEFYQVRGWSVIDGAVIVANRGWVKVEDLVKWRQHDGTPCDVEVEE